METDALLATIETENRHLVSRFSPDVCIDLLDSVPATHAYHELPTGVTDMWKAIQDEFGETGFQAFQNITVLRLIARFDERRANRRYTDAIVDCFDRSFRRIVTSIADPAFVKYRNRNDILLKDLALCRQFMFPAGMRIVEPDSGFSRSLMFRAGIGQALRFLAILIRTGGHRHWYQVHTHLCELDDFNADGWVRCSLRLADMLKLHPEIKGVWTGSWFNDPVIANISPRLAYLRQMPEDAGACVFFSNVDTRGGALSKSPTRRKAYEAGTYLPKSYTLIWPRRELLAWAEKMRQ